MSAFDERKSRLARGLGGVDTRNGASIRLDKDTSNLFRDRAAGPRRRLDVREFNHVLGIDVAGRCVEVEGMTTYDSLVSATLAHGLMPCVVPQLKSITIGGAVAGVGIESSSFRHGLVHESIEELEVLLGDGSVVIARPDNGHSDLFYGMPNSYGTLGYVLRARARTVPVRPYVRLAHIRHAHGGRFFADLARRCESDADFLDAVVFGPTEQVITEGRFVDTAPGASDYTYERIYYQSLRKTEADYLTAHDYLWRWDTDWFWCSKHLLAQNAIVRRLLGRKRLNSVFYSRVMRWNTRFGITRRLDRMLGKHPESVIQDVDIPIARAPDFLEFLLREIGILPIWICPFRSPERRARWPLFPADHDTLYVNFGFWDVVRPDEPHPAGHFNRLIERKVQESGGIKSLYSDSYFPEDEFWSIYDKTAYDALKARYDPDGVFKNLYEKAVLNM